LAGIRADTALGWGWRSQARSQPTAQEVKR